MIKSSLVKTFIFALSIISFVACDTDYNNMSSDIIDDDVHHNMIRHEAGLVAYDKATGVVQSNNLPLNILGIYDNPVFGKTTAHFVTQLEMETVNLKFYEPEVDSVYLYVPYYSAIKSTEASGVSKYELDSIYGDTTSMFKLHVYENRFFLRDSDPTTSASALQKYYSDDKGSIDAQIGMQLNNFSDPAQNEQFRFTAKDIARTAIVGTGSTPKVVERKAPGIFMYLDIDFFRNKIFSPAANGKLLNNNVFKEYLRGLYFRVEQIGDQAVMAVPRFDQGTITIKYRDYIASSTNPLGYDNTKPKEKKTMTLKLDGNTINFFENTFKPAYSSALAAQNTAEGDERLFVKGGEGSMALINIDASSFAELKPDPVTGQKKVLVNEANLVFNIDQDASVGMGQFPQNKKIEPLRVTLYDVNNKRPLADYYSDATTIPSNQKYDKYVHGGLLERDANKNGVRYKIRITNHINNLINKDSTNVKLGLVVTEYINLTGNAALKTPFTDGSQNITTVPVSSVIHPFGTVLYGTNPLVPEDKRLKLEIFYTKPN